jgi:hypothetical protein
MRRVPGVRRSAWQVLMAAIVVLALVGMHQLLQQSCADALAAHGSHGSSLGVVDGELPPEHDAAGPPGSAIETDEKPSGVSGVVGGSACLAIVITLWLAAPLVRSRLRRPRPGDTSDEKTRTDSALDQSHVRCRTGLGPA